MRINDEILLKEMKKDSDKSKRVNSYQVKYMKHDGNYITLTFNQGYDHSTDVYNPFFVRVYDEKKNYVMSGCGSNIEESYNNLITSLILYKDLATIKRDEYNKQISQIMGILNIDDEN